MIDEWACNFPADFSNAWQRANQDLSRLQSCYAAASDNKRAHASHPQGDALELPVTNAFVSRKNNPSFRAGTLQPDFVRSSLREVIGKALD